MGQEKFKTTITGAYAALDHSIQMCSAIVEQPLSAICDAYWKAAIDTAADTRVNIVTVPADELVASSSGDLYWVPDGIKYAVLNPMPLTPSDKNWDNWLGLNAVLTHRIIVDPISIDMSQPLWLAAYSDRVGKIEEAFRTRFDDILSTVTGLCKPGESVAVIPPRAVMSQGEAPFSANIFIACRCGKITKDHK